MSRITTTVALLLMATAACGQAKEDAGDGKQRLSDQRASKEAGQRAADECHERDERVAEGVVIDDLVLGKALGAGGADVILAHNFQQAGAHQAGQVADGIAAHGDDGQDVALPAVQAEGRQYVQLKGEYINQHGGDHERRNSNADGGNGHQQHILPFAVFQRR